MKKLRSSWLLLGVLFWTGCVDCNDCGVQKNDPKFTVQFFSYDTEKSTKINILSINQIASGEIEVIGDTLLSEYSFPLDMNSDTSCYLINSFKEEDTLMTNLFQDTLIMTYGREYVRSERDFILVIADSMKVYQHSFDSIRFSCNFPDCINNEVVLKIFY